MKLYATHPSGGISSSFFTFAVCHILECDVSECVCAFRNEEQLSEAMIFSSLSLVHTHTL